MSIYNRILLALDLSSNTDLLCRKARKLADLYQAELFLLHVNEPIITDSAFDTLPALPADFEDTLLQTARKRLEHSAAELGVKSERVFLEIGETRHEIIRVAEEQKVDLIVVGSHGRSGVALLLGSTANAVLHHAKCDVLAVRITD
jgi:universal stress protein A